MCWEGRGRGRRKKVKAFPVKFIILFYVCINYECETGEKKKALREKRVERLSRSTYTQTNLFTRKEKRKNDEKEKLPEIFTIVHIILGCDCCFGRFLWHIFVTWFTHICNEFDILYQAFSFKEQSKHKNFNFCSNVQMLFAKCCKCLEINKQNMFLKVLTVSSPFLALSTGTTKRAFSEVCLTFKQIFLHANFFFLKQCRLGCLVCHVLGALKNETDS